MNYLKFVWQSLIHPNNLMDIVPFIQLLLFGLFLYLIYKAIKTYNETI